MDREKTANVSMPHWFEPAKTEPKPKSNILPPCHRLPTSARAPPTGNPAVCAVRPCGLARQRLGLLHAFVRSLRQGRLRAAHAARAGVEAAGVPVAYAREEALPCRDRPPTSDLLRTCYHHGYPIRHRHHPTGTATTEPPPPPPPSPPHRYHHRPRALKRRGGSGRCQRRRRSHD